MCGVIGFTSELHRKDLGLVAAELLKTLEYRGYDSTGAAIQGNGDSIDLRKGVGAPTVMVEQLGIVGLEGSILCGQVRWATFGSVDELNAQPHEVRCKTHIYGAHNGNVTNCDDLKAWLQSEGHDALSDNDGEMLVHTVEHLFAEELAKLGDAASDPEQRRSAMRMAILGAADRLEGSYAAVIVDPVSRTNWAIKEGSSLYFGFGRDETGGDFALASSDLSSVLKLTRVLIPMSEGEMVEYTPGSHRLYSVEDREGRAAGTLIERQPVRSRLQAKDAELLAQFGSFMEQEIFAQVETCRRIAELFGGGSDACRRLAPLLEGLGEAARASIDEARASLRREYEDELIHRRFEELLALPEWKGLLGAVPEELRGRFSSNDPDSWNLASLESGLLDDLMSMAADDEERVSVRLLDVLIESDEVVQFNEAVEAFLEVINASIDHGGRIFVVCCGSSYHAALAGAIFFNEIARTQIQPVLPGEFRGRFARSLRSEDVVVAISQSGETKDLIDVMNQVMETDSGIRRVGIVNNVSSTLGQEKCEIVLPLRCGPEIAVPATKSFMNQMVMLYALAVRLGWKRLEAVAATPEERERLVEDLELRDRSLEELPDLIHDTLSSSERELEVAAKMLALRPSMHVLSTRLLAVAREGALKIREVVLNHTEGIEGSEFKHGPNTILGFNTIFGIEEILRAVDRVREGDSGLSGPELVDLLYEDYPLVFITGPDETDVNLTISQLNTHKIRGTSCVVIAEEHAGLRQAVTKPPADNPDYRSCFIVLPSTGDNLKVVFSATVILQRLALRMSLIKQQYLDDLGVKEHGVHPDVPKNVSKSITVD